MLPIDQPDSVSVILCVGTLSALPTFLHGLLSPTKKCTQKPKLLFSDTLDLLSLPSYLSQTPFWSGHFA